MWQSCVTAIPCNTPKLDQLPLRSKDLRHYTCLNENYPPPPPNEKLWIVDYQWLTFLFYWPRPLPLNGWIRIVLVADWRYQTAKYRRWDNSWGGRLHLGNSCSPASYTQTGRGWWRALTSLCSRRTRSLCHRPERKQSKKSFTCTQHFVLLQKPSKIKLQKEKNSLI